MTTFGWHPTQPQHSQQSRYGPQQVYGPPPVQYQQHPPQYYSHPPQIRPSAGGSAPAPQSMLMASQFGQPAPAPLVHPMHGGGSMRSVMQPTQLQALQHREAHQAASGQHEVESMLHYIHHQAEAMYTQMQMNPSKLFSSKGVKAQGAGILTCGDWCAAELCGCCCNNPHAEPKQGTHSQNTIAILTQMNMCTQKIVTALNLGSKRLLADPHFQERLTSTSVRVNELVDAMRNYHGVYVCQCCHCFPCCVTNQFGGVHRIEAMAEKLVAQFSNVRSKFTLKVDMDGAAGVQGQVGHNVSVHTASNAHSQELGATRFMLQTQGQTVGMMDVEKQGEEGVKQPPKV